MFLYGISSIKTLKEDDMTVKCFGIAFIVVWIASAIASLAFIGFCGYVAWHFISKFW